MSPVTGTDWTVDELGPMVDRADVPKSRRSVSAGRPPLRVVTGLGERADSARAAQGDPEAFERLYRTHLPRIFGLVRRMTGGIDAEDLTQDVFVRAWSKLDSFRGDSSFGTWLYRLAVNVVVERFRTLSAKRNQHIAVEPGPGDLAVPPDRPEARLDFEAALDELPPGAREIFVLHDVEGYKHSEIGGLLGISVGTSKAQLHRARMILRRHL
jgi:RNA polymerase sigma-70 factor (ECF subfamily)